MIGYEILLSEQFITPQYKRIKHNEYVHTDLQ